MVQYTQRHLIWNSSCSAYFGEYCSVIRPMASRKIIHFSLFLTKKKGFHRKFHFHKSVISEHFFT